MLKSLYWKLTLAFILVAVTAAALVAVFIRFTNVDRLTQLIVDQQRSSLETALSSYYTANGSWSGIAQDWQQIQYRTMPTPVAQPGDHPPQGGQVIAGGATGGHVRTNFLGLADAQGVVIVPVDPNYPVGSQLPADILRSGTPVTANGEQVGTILVARQPPGFNPQEAQFLQRTNQALLYAVLGTLVIALLIGIILARTLTRPLHALTQAAVNITQGQLEQQVDVRSNDEIGQLAAAFNSMSQEVARVNQLRRQMTADIAHDLRTPLTVVSGYIESMRDGVLKPTPERLTLIYSEIERLQNLVSDLRMLSLADAGELSLNPQWISPNTLLRQAANLFQHQAEQRKVDLETSESADVPDIYVDESRMMQIFGNLISNALRFTPAGGKITLSTQKYDNRVDICVQDTGEGIEPGELPNIFDRFHRVDKSRHMENGESGLGLAIVKALVELHGGSVTAESTPGRGTLVHLIFPTDGGRKL